VITPGEEENGTERGRLTTGRGELPDLSGGSLSKHEILE
jgi:hypothetical protein